MTNASEAVTNAYNQGVRDGIRRLADSIKGNPTGDVSSLLQDARQDAVRSPQSVAEALATGVSAVRSTSAYESLQEAFRDLYRFVVEHLDPEPGPVQEYIREAGPQAAAIEAVGDENWSYADHRHPLDGPVPEASPEVEEAVAADEAEIADIMRRFGLNEAKARILRDAPNPQRSFLEGMLDGMGEER
jgi:hypothetical protein